MIAMKVLSGIGGSSGALFGTFFISMAKSPDLDKDVEFSKACKMIVDGVKAMKERGKADVGEKTMMDVLIPVSEKLNELKTDNVEPLTSIAETTLKLRPDEVKSKNIREQIVKNSPQDNEDYFVVPKVIE